MTIFSRKAGFIDPVIVSRKNMAKQVVWSQMVHSQQAERSLGSKARIEVRDTHSFIAMGLTVASADYSD
jgi:hypothetical protein